MLHQESSEFRHLSPREREVLSLVASGLSCKAIGDQLGITAGTVEKHITAIREKLQARNRVQLVARAMRTGALPIEGHSAPQRRIA